MDRTLAQQPLDNQPVQEKSIPDPNTDFDDDVLDYNPMPRSRISPGGLNEWIFNKLRPKSKVSAKALPKQIKTSQGPAPIMPAFQDTRGQIRDIDRAFYIPEGYTVENGILIQKKSLAERVRDQMHFPVLKSSRSIINGAALVLFISGAFMLYSELPTHPELVTGIIIVAISANIIISNR